jgi:hypothetical protein
LYEQPKAIDFVSVSVIFICPVLHVMQTQPHLGIFIVNQKLVLRLHKKCVLPRGNGVICFLQADAELSNKRTNFSLTEFARKHNLATPVGYTFWRSSGQGHAGWE